MTTKEFAVAAATQRPSVRYCADFRPDVAERLTKLAGEAGVGVSEVIRQAVDQALGLQEAPTAKQRKLGRWMARVLGIELPKGVPESRAALSEWITRHKDAFERRIQDKGPKA